MENLCWCRMELITTHSAQHSGKWIVCAAEREMWDLSVCFWKKLDQSSWPWAAGRRRNPTVKPVGFEATICRNAAWGDRKCIRVFFHSCEGRKPEEYLISWTVADPQNKPKLIKFLQKPWDTENHSILHVKGLTFGKHECLVVWPMLWKGWCEQLGIRLEVCRLAAGCAGRIFGARQIAAAGTRRKLLSERCKRERRLRSVGEAYLSLQICC